MEEPKLEQFGLTKVQYDYLNKKENKDYAAIMIICIVLTVLAASYIQLSDPDNSNLSIAGRISGLFLIGLVLGGLGGSLIGLATSVIYSGVRNTFSRDFRNLKKYEAAKQKYILWWSRNQELFWVSLGGKRFEYELAYLYSKLGYQVKLPKRGQPDKGVDFALYKDGKKIIVQCKAHQKPVGPHVIRDLYGTLASSKADEAILASISGFTSGVKEYALGKPIDLVSLGDIIRMRKQIPLE